MAQKRLSIPIHLRDAGMRLDRFILTKFPKLSHSILYVICDVIVLDRCKMLRKQDISLLGLDSCVKEGISIGTRIESGQMLVYPEVLKSDYVADEMTRAANKRLVAAKLSLDDINRCREWVLYADSHLIAINKPPGLPVQGGPGIHRALDSFLPIFRETPSTNASFHSKYVNIERATAESQATFPDVPVTHRSNFLNSLSVKEKLMMYDGSQSDDEILDIPRLVHRLDADTSGVMILARSRIAAQRLTQMFQTHSYDKLYWSLVFGRPAEREGVINIPLVPIKSDNDDKIPTRAVSARTSYRTVAERSDGLATWVLFEPKNGRKHQIRRHAVDGLNCPIFGDPKYGEEYLNQSADKKDQLYRMLDIVHPKLHLHSRKLRFVHPFHSKLITITAPPPAHMLRSFKRLKFDLSDL